MTDVTEVMKRNALSEVEELAALHAGAFTDEDVVFYMAQSEGDSDTLTAAAAHILEHYNGSNRFMNDQVRNLQSKGRLTPRQIRAVINIHTGKGGKTVKADACTPPHLREYECFVCHKTIVGQEVIKEHGRLHREGVLDEEGNEVAETPVIAVTTSELNLDLSGLQNGRYAAPDLAGRNDMVFLMVTRTRKDKIRDRRYRFGKYRTGREKVPAGTIEVKEWSSDSKRLCGQQKPGEVYMGEFEEQLQQILGNPEVYAKLFGFLVGHCYICGKTLTDEESRAMGIGPECEKKRNYWTTAPKSYIATGA